MGADDSSVICFVRGLCTDNVHGNNPRTMMFLNKAFRTRRSTIARYLIK